MKKMLFAGLLRRISLICIFEENRVSVFFGGENGKCSTMSLLRVNVNSRDMQRLFVCGKFFFGGDVIK